MTAFLLINLEFLTEAVPFQWLHSPINVSKCSPEPFHRFAALRHTRPFCQWLASQRWFCPSFCSRLCYWPVLSYNDLITRNSYYKNAKWQSPPNQSEWGVNWVYVRPQSQSLGSVDRTSALQQMQKALQWMPWFLEHSHDTTTHSSEGHLRKKQPTIILKILKLKDWCW